MFFSKYNIDPMGKIGSYSINDLIGDLEAKPKSIPTVPEKSEKLQHAADGTPLVSLDNFLEYVFLASNTHESSTIITSCLGNRKSLIVSIIASKN